MAKNQAMIKKGEKNMKKASLTMTVLGLTFIIAIGFNCFAGEGPDVLKVKGLYIGMDLSEAKKAVSKLTDGKRQLVMKFGHCYHCDDEKEDVIVFVDDDDKVVHINFHPAFVDQIFGAAGSSGKEFVQVFEKEYKIPSMKETGPASGGHYWQFKTDHGYKVRIYESHEIHINKLETKEQPHVH